MDEGLTVVLAPRPTALQVLATLAGHECLRAVLPQPMHAHPRAVATLLEALALWAQCPGRVVWSAASEATPCDWELFDALGFGVRRLHFEIAYAPMPAPRVRALGGPGSFRALQRLARTGGAA